MRALKRTKRFLVAAAVVALTCLPLSKGLSYPRKTSPFLRSKPIAEKKIGNIDHERAMRGVATVLMLQKKGRGQIIEKCLAVKNKACLSLILKEVNKAPVKKAREVGVELAALSMTRDFFYKPDKKRIVLSIAVDNTKTYRAMSKNKQGALIVRKSFQMLAAISKAAAPILKKIEKWVFSKEDQGELVTKLSKG
jgi:hypothetical protein